MFGKDMRWKLGALSLVFCLGGAVAQAANNPNGYIRIPGWNFLLLNTDASISCHGGGPANQQGNWVAPHDIGAENPKVNDVWNDIVFGLPKATGWSGQKLTTDIVWLGVDGAGNLSHLGNDGVTVVGGIGTGDTVDFQNVVDRINTVIPTDGAAVPPRPAMQSDNMLAIATTYVRNNTASPINIQIGSSSDDSPQVYLNDVRIITKSDCRGTSGDFEDLAATVLPPGISKITAMVWEGGGGWGLRCGIVKDGIRLTDTTGPLVGIEFLGTGAGDPLIVGQAQGTDGVARKYAPYGWVVSDGWNILGPLDNPYGAEAGNTQNMLRNWTAPYDIMNEDPKSGDVWDINFARAASTGYAASKFLDALGLGDKPTWFTVQDLRDILDNFGGGLGAGLPGSGVGAEPFGKGHVNFEDMIRYASAKLKPFGIPTIDGRNCPNPADYNADCDPDNVMAVATTYVQNNTGADLPVWVLTSSDDSIACFVNCQVVTVHSLGRGSDQRFFNDQRPAILPPGISKIAIEVFEGGGGFDWRLGLRPLNSGAYNYTDGSPQLTFLGPGSAGTKGVKQFCMERTVSDASECSEETTVTIKGNGQGNPFVFPDDVVIEGNELYNSTLRITGNPVTPIDVVGGRRWVIRGNFIHDHGKGGGDGISYAAFLKGNSRSGLFERNLVICERDHTGGIRLGLSFGGGGTAPESICEGGTCTPEHQDGVMRNNLIVNCPQDVGIYLNKAARTGIYNNTLYNTTGIDVRFTASTADLRNNLLSGAIRNRDGGTSTKATNREGVTPLQWTTWFVNPAGSNFALLDGSQIVNLAQPLAQVPDDYCGKARGSAPDIGAVEYGGAICNTAQPSPGGLMIFTDGFETGGVGEWGMSGGG